MTDAIKAVLFDWAGTMVDFGSCAPVAAMRRVFAGAGVPVAEEVVRRYMGQAKREHVVAMLSEPEVADRWRAAHDAAWSEADIDRLMTALEPAMQAEAEATATLVPGALDALRMLEESGIRVGSTTGYTRTMMAGILPRAEAQSYAPEVVVCAGETRAGRPAPLMLWKAMAEMGVWPADAVVVVDDAPVGIEAGRNAGCWCVGVAASGNALGLDLQSYRILSDEERRRRLREASQSFVAAGADVVVPSVAELSQALAIVEQRRAAGDRPGAQPCAIELD